MNRILLMFVLTVFSAISQADVEIKTLLVEGFGVSYGDAIQNGLIEALKQAEGVSINSQKAYAKSIREKAVSSSDTSQSSSTHEVAISEAMLHSVREATQGVINEYHVINAQDIGEGEWSVQLEIKLKKYKTPGISPHSLRKIAVIPFRTKTHSLSIMGKKVSAKEISRQFSQKLVTELTQSRRFSVLDREYMLEFLKEKNLLLSSNASNDEQMKVGEALGVDYLLLGTITEFKGQETSNYIKTLNETVYGANAQLNTDFRIMVMATRQIKWSDTVKVTATANELKRVYQETGNQGVIDYMLEESARRIVHTSLDNIYPLKILKVAGKKSIYLNQGGKMTAIGDIFDVYTPGESITDPDTGLAIKIDGEQVATVKVTKVQAKYSLAKLIKGDLKQIVSGAILRKSEASENEYRPPAQKVIQPAW